MRHRFGALDRLTTPVTSYPFSSSSSARYDPSCPVIPVMIARLVAIVPLNSIRDS